MKGRERRAAQRQEKAEAVGAAVPTMGQAAAPGEPSEGIEQSCSETELLFFKREQLFPCGDETEQRSRDLLLFLPRTALRNVLDG